MHPVDELLCSTRAQCRTCHWSDGAGGCRLLAAVETVTAGVARPLLPAMQARLALA